MAQQGRVVMARSWRRRRKSIFKEEELFGKLQALVSLV